MPVVADEAGEYGYIAENRHMVQSFLKGVRPEENFCGRRGRGRAAHGRLPQRRERQDPRPSPSRGSRATSLPWPRENGTRKPSEIPGGPMKRTLSALRPRGTRRRPRRPRLRRLAPDPPHLARPAESGRRDGLRGRPDQTLPLRLGGLDLPQVHLRRDPREAQGARGRRGRSVPGPGAGGPVPGRPLRREHDRRAGRHRQGVAQGEPASRSTATASATSARPKRACARSSTSPARWASASSSASRPTTISPCSRSWSRNTTSRSPSTTTPRRPSTTCPRPSSATSTARTRASAPAPTAATGCGA